MAAARLRADAESSNSHPVQRKEADAAGPVSSACFLINKLRSNTLAQRRSRLGFVLLCAYTPTSSGRMIGMSLTDLTEISAYNPLDNFERLATTRDWAFDRSSDDEVTLVVTGEWTEYHLSFTWMTEIEALHLACAFDLKVPALRRTEVIELVTKINEQMWVGHFDLWTQDGIVMYRHALVLAGGVEASGRQCEALLGTALDACERYFPAFQFVVWAGKGAREALDAAMFETAGEA
jgi:hypothetical protein